MLSSSKPPPSKTSRNSHPSGPRPWMACGMPEGRYQRSPARVLDEIAAFSINRVDPRRTVEHVGPFGSRECNSRVPPAATRGDIEGQGRTGVFASAGQARTFDFQAGDVGYAPFAMGHFVKNTRSTPLRFLEMFKSSYYADLSLQSMARLDAP